MAKITPVLKVKIDYLPKIVGYISVLTTLHKILKRIMCNGIFRSLAKSKVLFLKYFALQKNTSTEK